MYTSATCQFQCAHAAYWRRAELIIRTLQTIVPTAEQLSIFSRTRPGVELIRGAAGSGKTTTALLKLRSLIGFYIGRRKRSGSSDPVRVLVLTYNRTLRGYISELATAQFKSTDPVEVEVDTFARWSRNRLGNPSMVSNEDAEYKISSLGSAIPLANDFLYDEVDYVTGRFLRQDLPRYLTSRREGRGSLPRVDRPLRARIVDEIILPYNDWKEARGEKDWNDLAIDLAKERVFPLYDVVIADETQDFSANQIRALMNQVQADHSATFVLDSAQRIYPRGFTWAETGLTISGDNSKRLTKNYRNTVEIANLAASLVQGLVLDDDGTVPAPKTCVVHGDKPKVAVGLFSKQLAYAISHIRKSVDLTSESVAFLHPKGGRWLNSVRAGLIEEGLDFVEMSRRTDWPTGSENIGLSTLHSAKGLEFDHVIILGLNTEVTQHGDEEEDDSLSRLRRLLAMGIGRARKTVILGYKPQQASKHISYLDSRFFDEVAV